MEMTPPQRCRHRFLIQGAVQGVGFRPFVYRLATELQLTGWVQNSPQGVIIEVEGDATRLANFRHRLSEEKPPHALIQTLEAQELKPIGESEFTIHQSDQTGADKTTIVLPDLATCPACFQEIFAPQNRRYRYPFTNCTHCGPRYSIIEALPYDRAQTTMAGFMMCPACQTEYENPRDRRFHAQPNACPDCGPQLALWNTQGEVIAKQDAALSQAVTGIKAGKIVAIKGLGGFQLLGDATQPQTVATLRHRKRRPDKPFALLYPNLAAIEQDCQVSPAAAQVLTSSAAPIVLLPRRDHNSKRLAPGVAPGNPYLGVMLPYTPLHHLLMAELGVPVVATSGNLADEPICIDEQEAITRLAGIADYFLVHNRPILRPVDDSVVRIIDEQPMILRRARGYAPLPIKIDPQSPPLNILAVGGHLKNTVAIAIKDQVFLSQHLGDLTTPEADQAFQDALVSLSNLYDFIPDIIVCDAHPDYRSRQFAQELATRLQRPLISVQHHTAHLLATVAEYQLQFPVLGVAWDGTGYGTDQTIWGGEFLHLSHHSSTRVAHLRPFPLPGGETAIKEPRRSALGLLFTQLGISGLEMNQLPPVAAFTPTELQVIKTMLSRKLNTPLTSSMGRLFDGVAALLGLGQRVSFTGQAAMALEFVIGEQMTEVSYQFELETEGAPPMIINWIPMLNQILQEIEAGVPAPVIAAQFHNTLVEMIIAVAQQVGESQIVLTGGCFQNRYLLERAIRRLRQAQFCPYWSTGVPVNDGGIALGQVIAARRWAGSADHLS